MPIKYIEELPKITIDSDGVGGVTKSGDDCSEWRCRRSLWRAFLETEIRRLNEWEGAERIKLGRAILPFERRG